MATVTELETLVVKLVGDVRGYMAKMGEASAAAKKVGDDVEKQVARIEGLGGTLSTFAGTMASSLGAIGIGTGLWSAFQKFEEFERNVRRMNVAIQMNGGDIRAVTDDYAKFAAQLAETTTISKGTTMGLLRQAEAMGISGDRAKEATKFAIGFAAATGISEEQAMGISLALQRGNTHMLRRIQQFRGMRNEQEMLARAQTLANQGLMLAEQEANTATGALTRMQRSVTALTKELGGMVAFAIRPAVEQLSKFVEWFNKLDPRIRTGVVTFLALTGAIKLWPTIVAGATMALKAFGATFIFVRNLILLGMGPLGLLFAAIIVAAAVLIQKFGGVEAVWKSAQETFTEGWTYLEFGFNHFGSVVQHVWNSVELGYTRLFYALGGITDAAMEGVENRWAASAASLGVTFDQFRRQRQDDAARAAVQAGRDGLRLGDSFAHGAQHGIHKVDQALAGSAEAFTRIAEYQDKLNGRAGGVAPTTTTQGGGGPNNIFANVAGFFDNIGRGLMRAWDDAMSWLGTTWDEWSAMIAANGADFGATAARVLWDMFEVASRVWEDISAAADRIWMDIQETAARIWNDIYDTAVRVWDDLSESFGRAWEALLSGDFLAAWNELSGAVTRAFGEVSALFDRVGAEINNVVGRIGIELAQLWVNITDQLVVFGKRTWDQISGYALRTWVSVGTFFERTLRSIPGVGALLGPERTTPLEGNTTTPDVTINNAAGNALLGQAVNTLTAIQIGLQTMNPLQALGF